MTDNCTCAVQGRNIFSPLECKIVINTLARDFLLTDVVFELYTYPNGLQSMACGYVWNTMPNQWSRELVGGDVDTRGRQYHFETGLLCPRGSRISVCNCFFVNQPTGMLKATLSGCSCDRSGWTTPDLRPPVVATIDWMDAQPLRSLDPIDPTVSYATTLDVEFVISDRELLGTARDRVGGGDLWIDGQETRTHVAPGETRAIRVAGDAITWTSGEGQGRTECPQGTSLAVVRRSSEGQSVHWIFYREGPGEAT